MADSFDTIIIGAGLSGLAAGIRLAYFDKSVCILERHTTIGGLNSFYRLRGHDHDVGLHAVTNYAKPGTRTGPLSKLLRQLRLRWDDFGLCPQVGSAVVFPGRTLRFTNDFEYFQQQVVDEFPSQADGFQRLLKRIDDEDELNLDRVEVSARAVVSECITDPILEDMIFCPLMFYGSATPHDMDFSQFVIMFKSLFYQGFGRPFAGIRLILKQIVRKFRSQGGQLMLRSGVRSINSDNGRVIGVTLDDGRELTAANVVSSAGSVETMRLCGEHQPPSPLTPGEISFVESISTIDRQPADLGHNETIIFYNDAPRFTYACPSEPLDLSSGIICSPNNFQYDECLPDGRVRITALANPSYWLNLPDDEYQSQKQAWVDRMISASIKHIPDFRPHTVDTDAFTPRTIKHFTGHINGCVYGAAQKLVNGQTHIKNLYVCGTDQGFLGIIGSMLSGITIANRYLMTG